MPRFSIGNHHLGLRTEFSITNKWFWLDITLFDVTYNWCSWKQGYAAYPRINSQLWRYIP